MSRRTIIRDWPGLMRLETAASYCDMTPGEFAKAVATGELPNPVPINGIDRWRLIEIDESAARRTGYKPKDWREELRNAG